MFEPRVLMMLKLPVILALIGIIFVRYGNRFSRFEQVENAPKFSRPSEGEKQFTNGF